MTGWHFSVYRQRNGGESPFVFGDVLGERLAVWQANVRGLDWIDRLAENGRVVKLAEGGYPSAFSIKARDVLPVLEGEPPEANDIWIFDLGDIIGDGWVGRTTKSEEVIAACSPDEWLIIEVWDEN